MTPDQVKDRLKESADVIRRTPKVLGPGGYRNAWPEIIRQSVEAYGYEDAQARDSVPTNEEIDKAWEAANWLNYLSYRDRRIVWAWANRTQWWQLVQRHRRAERTIRNWFDKAIERICQGLNRPSQKAI